MEQLDLEDIQGIILHGYGDLDQACFVLLAIDDVGAAKEWLGELAGQVRNSEARPHDSVVNVAFTLQGLRKLGIGDDVIGQFAREFREGMHTPQRRSAFGDHGDSAPEGWEWGAPGQQEAHVLLMLYALDDARLRDDYDAHAQRFTSKGMVEVRRLDALTLQGRKEHFGFRDGIAQPLIEGLNKLGAAIRVKAGEFVLGYVNEYGQYTESPLVPNDGPAAVLPNARDDSRLRDLGRNGSYMVFRQMAQNVHGFWSLLDQATKNEDGSSNPQAMVALAAKMVGRWPSGAPLVNSPDEDSPALQDDDHFLYHQADPDGYRAPFGSHIRRTNPRDMLGPDPGSEKSIAVGSRHRILRRGRAYGPPIAESMDPVEILSKGDDGQDRGLHFVCFNTNIGRQFDFVNQTWVNNKRFAGLYDDADPVIGDHDPGDTGATSSFKVPASPVRERTTGIPRLVQIKGGAYFFMPGINAVHYLAAPSTSAPSASE